MILENIRFIVTQNSEREVLENTSIKIRNGEIESIGDVEASEGEEVIDCSNRAVMPGLVNAHTHASMSLLRGISDNKQLMDWLEDDIFPAEDVMNADDIYTGALLASVEMLKTGTTCFNDMYERPDEVVEAVENAGIRAVVSRGLFDWDEQGEERIDEAKNAVEKYMDHELVTPAIAPHAVYTCSEELLKEMKDFSDKHGVPYHIHVSETEEENSDILEEEGLTPTQYLDDLGLFDSSVVAAHAAWLSEEDKQLFADRKANVAHNPAANLKLGSGIAEIPELMNMDVNVALGTDGPASNNNFNLFEEMKTAALVHKLADPRDINEQQVLDMATINGARALGLENEIGSLEEGKKADIVVIDLDDPEMTPFYGKKGLVSNIVFSYTGHPEKVIVNGETVMENGKVKDVDQEGLLEKVQGKVEKFEAARRK
ncbi:amidohydrolase [Candidatus Nanosalina sp. VS9-1]|uniref:amidohydrolase n=1 Tax=Candidatus Nanosalina sp. VS9-1 TaxID=3388566 RepID=UPI0039DFF7ED